MTTDKQVSANRSNAQLSTGPKTPAGKDTSKWNALRHGLRAETALVPGEDQNAYHDFRQALLSELAPAGELEAVLVDRIVSLAWRLQRAGRVDAGLFVWNHFDRLAESARAKARSYVTTCADQLFAELEEGTVTDPEAHKQATREEGAATARRDSDTTLAAAAFQHDSSDVFSKLARYETSIERSLYKALHELQRLQTARSGGTVRVPMAVDVNVDTGQAVA